MPVIRRVTVYCGYCGKDKSIKQSEYGYSKTKIFYCDRTCYGKGFSQRNRGENHPNYKGKITAHCVVCGKAKEVHPCRLNYHKVVVCSMKCLGVYNRSRYEGAKSPTWKGGLVTVTCNHCGKNIERAPSRVKHYDTQFCDIRCYAKWQSENRVGENHPNWRGGKSFEPYPSEWNERLRESVRRKDKKTCQLCGMSEKENKEKLSVHHIDYNKENNDILNLISLCHDCHAKTNFNRAHWQRYFSHIKAPLGVFLNSGTNECLKK